MTLSPKAGRLYRRRVLWIGSQDQERRAFAPFRVLMSKAEVLDLIGEWAAAEEIYRLQVEADERLGDGGAAAEAKGALGWLLHKKGDDGGALSLFSEVME